MPKKTKLPPRSNHGGPRIPGPGKKIGRPKGAGRVFVTRSISMPPYSWQVYDTLCGDMSRGEFLRKSLNLPATRSSRPLTNLSV